MRHVPPANVLRIKQITEIVSVPMAIGFRETWGHQAMGFLFAVADDKFLVTVRHAVHDVVKRGGGLWIPSDKTGKAIPLTPKFFFLDADEFDLAIMKLPEEILTHLTAHRFGHCVDVASSHQPEGTPCIMQGILAVESRTWNRTVTSDDKLLRDCVFTGKITTVAQKSESINNDLQFLISADDCATSLVNTVTGELSEIQTPESFRGLSGAPVFMVDGNPLEPGWNPRFPRVLGFQSGFIELYEDKRSVMQVVRSDLLFALLREAFPSTHEIIQKLAPLQAVLFRAGRIASVDLARISSTTFSRRLDQPSGGLR